MAENKVYIKEAACISAQNTFDVEQLKFKTLLNADNADGYVVAAEPDFKAYIPARKLRRVCTIIRRGLVSSLEVLKKANCQNPDAIVVGTGLGCLQETVSFLDTMISNDENFLNPSHFIQSTHNAISGQIALFLSCNNYNMTFTQKELSFEMALLDSLALFKEKEVSNVLLGGTDELDTRIVEKLMALDCNKAKLLSESSAFFFLDEAYSEVELLAQSLSFGKPIDIDAVLKQHELSGVDLIISGEYKSEKAYDRLKKRCPDADYVQYKHFFGLSDTGIASAMWLGYRAIKDEQLPEGISNTSVEPKNCMIYNVTGSNESLILLKRG